MRLRAALSFALSGTGLGRPVVPAVARDGSLLAADQVANAVWRISYRR